MAVPERCMLTASILLVTATLWRLFPDAVNTSCHDGMLQKVLIPAIPPDTIAS